LHGLLSHTLPDLPTVMVKETSMDRADEVIVNAFANPYYERFHLMCFWSVTDAQPWILFMERRTVHLQKNFVIANKYVFRSLANHKMALCYTQL